MKNQKKKTLAPTMLVVAALAVGGFYLSKYLKKNDDTLEPLPPATDPDPDPDDGDDSGDNTVIREPIEPITAL